MTQKVDRVSWVDRRIPLQHQGVEEVEARSSAPTYNGMFRAKNLLRAPIA